MKKLIVLALLSGVMCGGCWSRALKEGAGVALGAKGVHRPLSAEPADPYWMAPYGQVKMGTFTDGFSGKTPAGFMSALPDEFVSQVGKCPLSGDSSRSVTVSGEIIYYEDSSLFSQAFGPLEEVVARVKIIDDQSGQVVGEAICVGRTTESVNMGAPKKAQGLAKAIAGWIKKGCPPEPKQ